MSLLDVQFERLVDDVPAPIPMDDTQTYEMGVVESGKSFFADRVLAFLTDEPTVSTGTFSIGTNGPSYNNIVGTRVWDLISLAENSARDYPVLEDGGVALKISEGSTIKIKVTKGLLDSAGAARVVLRGFYS